MFPLILGLLLFFLSPVLPYSAHAYAAVVINELFPKTSDPSLSWVELYNDGSDQVSLDRWSVANTTNPIKTFTMNASFIIGGHTCLVLSQTQTGITFSMGGDTVTLIDDKGVKVDSQSYGGTLGYNSAMGRSVDGGGTWNSCTLQSPGKTNTCPAPTPIPTTPPTPSPLVVATPIPVAPLTDTPTPGSIPVREADIVPVVPDSFGMKYTPTSTPTPLVSPDMVVFELPKTIVISKILLTQIGIVLFAWSVLVYIAKKSGKKKNKT
jgi:hypothetical protein